jgi:hypothetical protein
MNLGEIDMQSVLRLKLQYLYIFAISLWLTITGWLGYQFQQHIASSQLPEIVNQLCRGILDNMFLNDAIFAFVTFMIAGAIFRERRTILYFFISYVVYTLSTTVSMFTLNDELISYQQHHGIWQGGVPMGQVLYVLLLVIIGVVSVLSYIIVKLAKWIYTQIRNRNN